MTNMYSNVHRRRGLTLLEMVIAVALMAVVFAAVIPQFRNIQNSWDSRQGGTEAIQNGRVLTEYLNRHLAQAVRITDVSEAPATSGYIEFEANDGITYRFDIAANNYVEYGAVGDLSDLAGPVSRLQFTCYGLDDLDTPLTISQDGVDSIRFIKVETTVTNSASLGNDKTFVASAYLQANANGTGLSAETSFEFDNVNGQTPAMAQIDSSHYLCAYDGNLDNGWAVVLVVDMDTWKITKGTPYEFDAVKGVTPALSQIDSTHYLCTYAGEGDDGWAVVLTVDTGTWNITKQTPFEFDAAYGQTPALAQIDSTHYLCAYDGEGDDGWATVLTVDTGTWEITNETPFEFDTAYGQTPALAKIDSTHYLCAYDGVGSDGWATVLTVDTGTWEITKGTPFEFDVLSGLEPALIQVDSTHYLCAYTGAGDDGWAAVLTVDTGTWEITKETAFEFDPLGGATPALSQIDQTRYICAYMGQGLDGWAVILTVNTGDWTISKSSSIEYDIVQDRTPALVKINADSHLCTYSGSGSDGWSVVLTVDTAVLP